MGYEVDHTSALILAEDAVSLRQEFSEAIINLAQCYLHNRAQLGDARATATRKLKDEVEGLRARVAELEVSHRDNEMRTRRWQRVGLNVLDQLTVEPNDVEDLVEALRARVDELEAALREAMAIAERAHAYEPPPRCPGSLLPSASLGICDQCGHLAGAVEEGCHQGRVRIHGGKPLPLPWRAPQASPDGAGLETGENTLAAARYGDDLARVLDVYGEELDAEMESALKAEISTTEDDRKAAAKWAGVHEDSPGWLLARAQCYAAGRASMRARVIAIARERALEFAENGRTLQEKWPEVAAAEGRQRVLAAGLFEDVVLSLLQDETYGEESASSVPDPQSKQWDWLTREALSSLLGWFEAAIGDDPSTDKIRAGLDWGRAIARRDEAALESARERWKALSPEHEGPPK